MITKLDEIKIIDYIIKQFKKKRKTVKSKELIKANILTDTKHDCFYRERESVAITKMVGDWNGIAYTCQLREIIFKNPADDDGGIGERERKRKEPTKGHERT